MVLRYSVARGALGHTDKGGNCNKDSHLGVTKSPQQPVDISMPHGWIGIMSENCIFVLPSQT